MPVSILNAFQKGFGATGATVPITLTAGNNRIAIAGGILSGGGGQRAFQTPTFGGINMIQIVTDTEAGHLLRASMYYLKESDLPADGSRDLIMNANVGDVDNVGAYIIILQDVDQVALIEDFGSASGNADTDSIILAITNGSFQLDMLNHTRDIDSLTWGDGQVERWDEDIGNDRAGASSQSGAPAGSETMSYVAATSQRHVYVAASIAAVPNPSPDPVASVMGVITPSIKTFKTRFELHVVKRRTSFYARPRNKGGAKEVWLNASPIAMCEGEAISFSIDWIGANKVENPTIKVYEDESEYQDDVFLSADSEVISGNVLTLRKLTVKAGDGGGKYVLEIKCEIDNNTEIRKLLIIVIDPKSDELYEQREKEIWVMESPIAMTELEAYSFSVDYLGASEVSTPVVTAWKEEEEETSNVFISGDSHTISENVLLMKKFTVAADTGGSIYILEIKGTVDGNILIEKFMIKIVAPGAEG